MATIKQITNMTRQFLDALDAFHEAEAKNLRTVATAEVAEAAKIMRAKRSDLEQLLDEDVSQDHRQVMKCALVTVDDVRKDIILFYQEGGAFCSDGRYLRGIEEKWGRTWEELLAFAGHPVIVHTVTWSYT